MREIIIDEGFRSLLPAPDAETYRLLEESIILNGCMFPLVLWNGILIDGYNRYSICTAHDIPFETVDKEFASRDDALIWIISNQISRRNLPPTRLSYYRGLHYLAARRRDASNRRVVESDGVHNEHQGRTAGRLAELYPVSEMTIRRDAQIASAIDAIGEVSPEAKARILSGKIVIDKKKLRLLASGQNDDIKALATAIDDGTYKRRPSAPTVSSVSPAAPASPDTFGSFLSEGERLKSAIGNIASSYSSAMQRLGKAADMSELRTLLREYIDTLEDALRRFS